ncbi:MAG: hypothetical protein AAFN13_11905 [Bacteroidota bacterium]
MWRAMAGEEPSPSRYDQSQPVSFIIGRNAGLDLADKQRLLEMAQESDRIRFLAEHLGALLVRLEQAREFRDRARGDGLADGFPELGS